ncbi:unnamed protein product, partial [Iphiclides podalirius]
MFILRTRRVTGSVRGQVDLVTHRDGPLCVGKAVLADKAVAAGSNRPRLGLSIIVGTAAVAESRQRTVPIRERTTRLPGGKALAHFANFVTGTNATK